MTKSITVRLSGDDAAQFKGQFRIGQKVIFTPNGKPGQIVDGKSTTEDTPVASYQAQYLVRFADGSERWCIEGQLEEPVEPLDESD